MGNDTKEALIRRYFGLPEASAKTSPSNYSGETVPRRNSLDLLEAARRDVPNNVESYVRGLNDTYRAIHGRPMFN